MTRAGFSLLWTPRTVGESSLHCLFCAGKSQESQICVAFTPQRKPFSRLIAGQDNCGKLISNGRLKENAISSRTGSALAVQVCCADWCTQLWWITIYYGLMLGGFLCLFMCHTNLDAHANFAGLGAAMQICASWETVGWKNLRQTLVAIRW